MKINDQMPLGPLTQKKTGEQTKENDGKFALALDEAVNKESSAASSVSPSALMATSGLLEVDPAAQIAAAVQSGSAGPVARLESAQELLAQYTEALGDPTQSLKDVDSLVKEMEEKSAGLGKLADELPSGPLKSLVNDTAVLMAVEAVKFNRGDYT